jgi:CubicO group peptidase (beta-lactamase class C family)
VELSDPARKAKILELVPQLDKQFADYREKQKLPGLAVGIVVGNELIYAKGFGVRDRETNAPVDPDTVFRIASMTKSFTGLAILKLRDEGKLSLEDPVTKYIPELARLKPFSRDSAPITVREILSHSAGFPEDNAWGDPRLEMTDQEFSAMLRRGLAFSTSPGTRFEYSNLGFALAGQIVQRVSGIRYQHYVTRYILKPLEMSATVWDQKNVPGERLAKGYERHSSNWSAVTDRGLPESVEGLAPQPGDGAFASMGGLYTSIRDYARYVSFQLNAWPARDAPDEGPVRRSSVRESHQIARHAALVVSRPSIDEAIQATTRGYGLGWGVSESCEFDRLVTHGGGIPGFGSYVVLLPDQGVGMFAFANTTYAPTASVLIETAKRLGAHGALPKRRIPISSALSLAQMVLLPLLDEWDDSRADRLFDKTFFQYNPRERLHADLGKLHQRHGHCWAVGEMVPENALRGRIQLECDRGQLDLHIALTPDEPLRVQWMLVTERLPPSSSMIEIARRIAGAIGKSSHEPLDELLAGELKRDKVDRQIAAAGETPCGLSRWLDGDGEHAADFELACGQQSLELRLRSDSAGKVKELSIRSLQDTTAKCPL